jgi:hypothetical protein
MPDPKILPPSVAVQTLTEIPQEVRAHAVGDRVSLLIGDDRSGVRFLGDRDELWTLIGRAGRALSEATNDDQ